MNIRSRLTQGPNFPPPEKLRLFVYGLPGCGKTYLCASIPDSLHIDVEGEAGFVLQPQAKCIVPDSGKDYEEILESLIQDGPSKSGFNFVSIDSIDMVVQMMIPWATEKHNDAQRNKRPPGRQIEDMREYGQGGAGWGKINDSVVGPLHRLRIAGYGLCITGHAKEEEITVQSPSGPSTKIVLRPSVNPGVRNTLYRYSQFCGKVRYSTKKKMRTRKTSSGKEVSDLVSERHYEIDLSASSNSVGMDAIVKARLVPFMAEDTGSIIVDITGPLGWEQFSSRYLNACKLAKESLNTKEEGEKNG